MELETERSVDWTVDTNGRKYQIERELLTARAKSDDLLRALEGKLVAIEKLKEENRGQISVVAQKAYQALENVVQLLLKVTTGDHRLSREDASIMTVLQSSVANFEELCAISRKNKDELGIKAGDCKELGDKAGRLGRALEQRASSLSTDATAALSAREAQLGYWKTYSDNEENLRDRLDEKEDSQGDFGNGFLNIFDSSVGDRLDREVQEAEDRLNENLKNQKNAKEKAESYYDLSKHCNSVRSIYLDLKKQVESVSARFADEYVKVVQAQDIEISLWTGLIDLKNNIWATDYVSTRDKSLRQLLNLLNQDDQVFLRQEFYESTETRIKDAIRRSLGADSVEKLINGKFAIAMDDGELNNL